MTNRAVLQRKVILSAANTFENQMNKILYFQRYVIAVSFLVLFFSIEQIETGCSAAVARFVRDEEVASSILATPTISQNTAMVVV